MKQLTTLLLIMLSCSFGFSQTLTNALKFDGSTSTAAADRIATTFVGLADSSARTVEMWIKRGTTSTSQGIMSEWGSGALNGGRFTCKVENSHLKVETGGATSQFSVEGTTLINSTSTWYHVAFVIDPNLTTDRVKIYLNGNLEASGYLFLNTATDIAAPLTIGSRSNGAGAFNGAIDDYRVWNVARTQADIQADMNKEFCNLPANLIHYFKFNEGIAGGNNTALTTVLDEVNPLAVNTLSNFTKTGTTSNFVAGKINVNEDIITINASACVDYFWAENGQTYNTTGQYDVVYTNMAGCDSTMRLNLTINSIDNTATDNGNGTLTANMPGMGYKWLDCNNGNAPISGLTSQTIIIPAVGSYAVEINNNGCLDTSNCINIASVPSYLNPAMNFDGTSDYVQTTTTGITGNGPRTVEAWINVPATNSATQHTIVDWGGTAAGSRFTTNILNQKLRLEVNGAGINGTTDLNDGQWHHVAVTYNPADNDTVRLYVGGIQEAKARITTINTQNVQIKIGTRFDNANFFFGDMDEVRVWNVAKSQAEIAAGMNSPICTANANLISSFTFNEGAPFANNTAITTLKDYAAYTQTAIPQTFVLNGTTSNFSIGPNVDNGLDFSSNSVTACDSYEWPVNNTTYNMSGVYTHTLVGANTCDSIIKLNLTINSVDNTVTDNMNSSLFANASGANYVWLDCDNNNTPIPTATNQTFIAPAIGNYAVEVTGNGCVDTSICINIASIPAFLNAAMNFDGSNDRIETTTSGLIGNSARTVESWIKVPTNNNTAQHVILSWGTAATGGSFTTSIINHKLRLETGNTTVNGTTNLNDGNWHHIAVTYDPADNDTIRLMVDGIVETKMKPTNAVNTVNSNIKIGAKFNDFYHFFGDLDEVKVWNVAKTPAEILTGMNNPICTASPSLISYFRFNEGVPFGNNTLITSLKDHAVYTETSVPTNISMTGMTSNFSFGPNIDLGLTYSIDQQTACISYEWPLNSTVYSVSGMYTHALTGANSCDSIVVLDLTINTVDNTVTDNMNSTMVANMPSANYVWLDCDNNNSPVPTAINQTFIAPAIGNYSVEISANGCVDTSDCINVASIPNFINTAMHFDGAGDYIATDFQGILGDNPVTVEAWVKTDGINNEQVITAWGSDVANGNRFTFRLANVSGTFVPRIEIKGGGFNGTIDLNDGMWHHVAVTYDPLLSTNKYKLFVDGALDTESDISQTLNVIQDVNMYIGKRINPGLTGYFSGAMDEVRVWNVAKSEADILAGKNSEICSRTPDLVAYFNLNEGIPGADNTSITEVLDNSGNDFIGTPNSFSLTGTTSNFIVGPVLNQGIQVVETSVASCGNYLWDIDNVSYTTDGDYVGVTTNINGCDSIVKMNLTILSSTGSTFTVTNCGPYTWPLTGNSYSISGFYNVTLQNTNGCDSMVTLALTVNAAINGASNNAGVLTATTSSASYKWLNCNTNALVPGETGQTFTPTTGGSYAVIVDNGVCVDTSLCMTVSIAGIEENDLSSTEVYPNPVVDELNVVFSNSETGVLTIVDIQGKTVKEFTFTSKEILTINLLGQEPGVYIVNIDTDNSSTRKRIILK